MADVKRGDLTTRDQLMEKADVWSFALTCLEVSLTFHFIKAFVRTLIIDVSFHSSLSIGCTKSRTSIPVTRPNGVLESLVFKSGDT
jgi:hypothetical protein